MPFRNALPVIVSTLLALALVSPATAGGEIVITQAKALAGAVTPGDTPGYPVTLSQPGAYMLESNLTVTPGTYGLFAGANNIDIDMNGFTLSGNGSGTYGLISPYGESRIHDGVINRFRYAGIYLRNNAWTIEDMKIVRNGGMGIDASGVRFISVRDSLIADNGLSGVAAGGNAVFIHNSISSNAGRGILCAAVCQIEENSIDKNQDSGVYLESGIVLGNIISYNQGYAIYDVDTINVGYSDNSIINNEPPGAAQVFGGLDIQPNICFGKSCRFQ